ncbi:MULTISPECIES: TraR/DksA family transcriptional regulator [unclassified Symbiopectobacterium]|uniref:TraR/DksA family transcriptional regulator n=1 Tax=unclassified Symbiopectobacterium TaxID=2794573 RepID=UPI00222720AD|nr:MULTISPECIES: TraR/DksA family transcriptional regulator [unclassified Symbiopectobacterium]MCW2474519.1 TraR/DksA family transcriptional regulator [Candidatus Symbiopectobacterium sp. NZEC151]MCW2482852.1 TraR/DksA family transcriptional regulator [Candidatus Symbiopectobacterium sp. NZEC135]MCW2488839.1 TraR/DksA family transcriptional regulator [Candidatus Symbiopectobacterium sp. NZEC127]
MPDDIDRDQGFNEQQLEAMIEKSRFQPAVTPSLFHCRLCGDPIPDKRRQTLPGVTTCISCQKKIEGIRR